MIRLEGLRIQLTFLLNGRWLPQRQWGLPHQTTGPIYSLL